MGRRHRTRAQVTGPASTASSRATGSAPTDPSGPEATRAIPAPPTRAGPRAPRPSRRCGRTRAATRSRRTSSARRGTRAAVTNSVWDGHCIKTFGAKNEVVSFNVVLEAATSKASKVSVSLGDLTGPGGAVLRSAPRATDKLFDWTTTEAELFYVRYLQIKGLSQQAYGTLASWQEATFPKRAQCPGMTQATPGLQAHRGRDAPGRSGRSPNKFYPDIAVPLELVPTLRHRGGEQPVDLGGRVHPEDGALGRLRRRAHRHRERQPSRTRSRSASACATSRCPTRRAPGRCSSRRTATSRRATGSTP